MEEGGEGGFGRYEEKSTSSVIQSVRPSPIEEGKILQSLQTNTVRKKLELNNNVHANII